MVMHRRDFDTIAKVIKELPPMYAKSTLSDFWAAVEKDVITTAFADVFAGMYGGKFDRERFFELSGAANFHDNAVLQDVEVG